MRISDWSSDVCSSDLILRALDYAGALGNTRVHVMAGLLPAGAERAARLDCYQANVAWAAAQAARQGVDILLEPINQRDMPGYLLSYQQDARSEEHTSELQSLMRISYAVFCLKK